MKKQLLEIVGDDAIKQMYIDRYIDFMKIDSKCDEDIIKDGTTIWIENASQRFAKAHPSIKTKLDVAAKMERLEVLIGIAPSLSAIKNAPIKNNETKKSGLL